MDLIPWRNKGRASGQPVEAERPLASLRDEVEGIFDRFMRDPWGTSLSGLFPIATGGFPQLDLTESDSDVVVRAELPGVRSDEVQVDVTGDVLRLCGEKTSETERNERGQYYSERQFGSFRRMIRLPAAVDADRVDATYKDGVLTIRMPKHPECAPKKVKVRKA